MTNCERCCFYEPCTKTGRTYNKDCIYGKKTEEEQNDKGYNKTDNGRAVF